MNMGERILRRLLASVLVFALLATIPVVVLAEDGHRSCSLEVSLMAERVKDDNSEEDWSFVILTGSGDEKTFHRIEVASQGKSDRDSDEETHISSADRLVEGEFYKLYSSEYSGKEDVFVGVQAIDDGQESDGRSGFGSTEFNLNCEDMFSEEVRHIVMSTLKEHEFKVTVPENKGEESGSETVWNVSAFVAYSGQHESRFEVTELANPIAVLLWFGWSWHVLF